MSASANLMRDIITKLSQPPSNPKSDFGKLIKYVDDNPMVKAAIRENLTTDEQVLNMIRNAGPSLDENGTPRAADDPQVIKDFEAYKTFKSMAQEYLDNQEKKKISRKINYQEFKKKVWNNWNKVSKWETSLSNKMLNTIKKIIPTEIDDAILKLGNKANDLTDAAVDKVTNFVNKRINRKIEELKAKEKEIGGKQSKTMKVKKNSNFKSNHPAWYTRFRTKDSNATPNYDNAIDELLSIMSDGTSFYRPLIVRFPMSLVLPNSKEGIKRIYQAINANQTSLMNARGITNVTYDLKDVTNYIENARFCLALIAKAQRTIKSYNNFNVDNVMEPDVLIHAENPLYYTADRIRSEKAKLVSLKEDLRLLIEKFKVNVAGSTPLYDRILFLMSNFFKDNKSSKNVVYMFDLDYNDNAGLFTYCYKIASSLQTETVTITDVESVLNAADTLIDNCFIKDKAAKQIKSDINYLYGLTKAQHFSTLLQKVYTTIDKPVDVVGNDYGMLRQIQNISVHRRPQVSHVLTGNHPGYNVYNNLEVSDEILLHETPLNGISGNVYKYINHNTDIVNSEKTLNSDETYVATRFDDYVNTDETMYAISVAESSNVTGVISLKTGSNNGNFKFNTTELIHSVQAITASPLFDGHNAQFNLITLMIPGNLGPVIIKGITGGLANENLYIYERAMMIWSFCDWMPRMYVNAAASSSYDSDAETVTLIDVDENSTDVVYDYNMTGRTPLSILKYIHSTALLSMLIWSDNGSNMISLNAKYAGNNNKSRDNSNK